MDLTMKLTPDGTVMSEGWFLHEEEARGCDPNSTPVIAIAAGSVEMKIIGKLRVE